MDIEKEQLKLRILELQTALMQYQHKEISAAIASAQQALFDASVDAKDIPSGATKQLDPNRGD